MFTSLVSWLLAAFVPGLLMLPLYMAAVGWALKRRKFRYLLLSAPFPVALYAALENR